VKVLEVWKCFVLFFSDSTATEYGLNNKTLPVFNCRTLTSILVTACVTHVIKYMIFII